MIRETKPRKAKYGFQVGFNSEAMREIAILYSVLQSYTGNPCSPDKSVIRNFWVETPNSMGKSDVLLYINDEDIYKAVKAAIEADEVVQPKLHLVLPVYRKHPGYFVEVASDEVVDGERFVCIAIGKYDGDVPDPRDELLKQALYHLEEHMREYHHVSPPELIAAIKKLP